MATRNHGQARAHARTHASNLACLSSKHSKHTCAHGRGHAHAHAHAHQPVRMHALVYTHTHTHTHTHTRTHARAHTHTHTHAHTRMRTRAHTHTHTHTHTHKQTHARARTQARTYARTHKPMHTRVLKALGVRPRGPLAIHISVGADYILGRTPSSQPTAVWELHPWAFRPQDFVATFKPTLSSMELRNLSTPAMDMPRMKLSGCTSPLRSLSKSLRKSGGGVAARGRRACADACVGPLGEPVKLCTCMFKQAILCRLLQLVTWSN